METIAKLLLACSKIIFCEAEIRNVSHSKHNDINIFGHTASAVNGRIYLLGGIGKIIIAEKIMLAAPNQ